MMAFGRLIGYATTGKDATGLAQWVWTHFDSGMKRTRVMTAYRLNDKWSELNNLVVSKSNWRQHYDYYRTKGILDPNPIQLFSDELFSLIKEWRKQGEEVVLLIDANDHIYQSNFAKSCAEVHIYT